MITPLASYMDREGIDDAQLATLIGRDRSMVSKLRRGKARPTLDLAATIERETKGVVSMQSWLASEAPNTATFCGRCGETVTASDVATCSQGCPMRAAEAA